MSHYRTKPTGQTGFFAIGVYHPKTPVNIGTLWRTAHLYGAAFIYTIGPRYKRQSSDTPNTPAKIPLFTFETIEDLHAHLPYSTPLIGVELDSRAVPLTSFAHPPRACYLLGAEDHGLPPTVLDTCHQLVQIETVRPESMNVAVAGSLVLHDRHVSRTRPALAVPA